jgi:hypothetical protein
MPARKTAELLLKVGRLVQAEGYDGELSVLPNGWRSATSRAPIRSPGTRRLLPSFKRPTVAPHRKPSRQLRQVGTWSATDPKRMDEASACD